MMVMVRRGGEGSEQKSGQTIGQPASMELSRKGDYLGDTTISI